MAALAVHALALLGDQYLRPSLLDVTVPFVSDYKTGWTSLGIIAGWATVLLGLSFYARRLIGAVALARAAPVHAPRLDRRARPHARRGHRRTRALVPRAGRRDDTPGAGRAGLARERAPGRERAGRGGAGGAIGPPGAWSHQSAPPARTVLPGGRTLGRMAEITSSTAPNGLPVHRIAIPGHARDDAARRVRRRRAHRARPRRTAWRTSSSTSCSRAARSTTTTARSTRRPSGWAAC